MGDRVFKGQKCRCYLTRNSEEFALGFVVWGQRETTMARKINRTENRSPEQKRSQKAAAGLDRKDYFSRPGATLAAWRGVHTCTPNGKAKANKNACRSRADY